MPNNVTKNVSTKVLDAFTESFEASRVITKTVYNQKISSDFEGAKYGDTIYIKRPHDYIDVETTDGDLSATTPSTIISGVAPAVAQNYITVEIPWTNKEEALYLNQMKEIIAPAAERVCLRLESNLVSYMAKNSGLHRGTVGNAVSTWAAVADTGALAAAIGVPEAGNFYAAMNPFAISGLANATNGLQSGSDSLVDTAWKKAQISRDFAGVTAFSARTLKGLQVGADGGKSGLTIKTTPDQTYATAKDTMQQTIVLTGFTASRANAVRAGDTIKVTQAGKYRTNIKTRDIAYDNSGALPIYLKVLTGGNATAGGDVTVVVSNAAIYEASGQYNNISAALAGGDTIQLLGTADAYVQPSLMYHEKAFGVGYVDLPKLAGWESSIIQMGDGIIVRVTKYSDARANTQKMRFDILPVFATYNPMFAGTFYGA